MKDTSGEISLLGCAVGVNQQQWTESMKLEAGYGSIGRASRGRWYGRGGRHGLPAPPVLAAPPSSVEDTQRHLHPQTPPPPLPLLLLFPPESRCIAGRPESRGNPRTLLGGRWWVCLCHGSRAGAANEGSPGGYDMARGGITRAHESPVR